MYGARLKLVSVSRLEYFRSTWACAALFNDHPRSWVVVERHRLYAAVFRFVGDSARVRQPQAGNHNGERMGGRM